jgi:Zn-dependent protease
MNLSLLFQEPWLFLVFVIAYLFTLSVHEFSHARMSFMLGDRTAEREGRLTLNPVSHVDLLGFLALVTVGFGWGKPVPFNPYNLKYQKWGPTFVALAGPFSNLLFGTLCILLEGLFVRLFGWSSTNLLIVLLSFMGYLNFLLLLFNLIPLPPLDGSKVLLSLLSSERHRSLRQLLEQYGPLLLLGLMIVDSATGIGFFSWIGSVARIMVQLVASLGAM